MIFQADFHQLMNQYSLLGLSVLILIIGSLVARFKVHN